MKQPTAAAEPPISALVLDFGQVCSLDQDLEPIAAVATRLGRSLDQTIADYYHHRRPYDQGLIDAEAYWSAVIGGPPDELSWFLDQDHASWNRRNEPILAWAMDLVDQGFPVYLLSNMPYDEKIRLWRDWPEFQRFTKTYCSCDLKLCKPDPSIFRHLIADAGLTAAETLFLDDIPANVAAGKAAGLRALVFTDSTLATIHHRFPTSRTGL